MQNFTNLKIRKRAFYEGAAAATLLYCGQLLIFIIIDNYNQIVGKSSDLVGSAVTCSPAIFIALFASAIWARRDK